MKKRVNKINNKILIEGGGTNTLGKNEILVENNNGNISLKERGDNGEIRNITGDSESSNGNGEDSMLYLKCDVTNDYFIAIYTIAKELKLMTMTKCEADGNYVWYPAFGSGDGNLVGVAIYNKHISSPDMEGGIMEFVDFVGVYYSVYELGMTNREEILAYVATFKEEILKLQITKEEFFEGTKIINAEGYLDLIGM